MQRVRLFGISIDPLTLNEAAERARVLAREPTSPCPFVVTPNLDHVVRLREDPQFRRAYAEAALVVADGMPLVVAARLFGRELPERVAGSDLVPAIFDAEERAPGEGPLRVFLLGAAPGVGERAARAIERRWKHVRVVGVSAPPVGFQEDATENERILRRIQDARTELLLVGLGAPKQELWVLAHRDRLHAGVALCIGATIDFLAGERPRAPLWMQRTGLEWLHRVGTEPRRLAKRYARNAAALPGLLLGEWKER